MSFTRFAEWCTVASFIISLVALAIQFWPKGFAVNVLTVILLVAILANSVLSALVIRGRRPKSDNEWGHQSLVATSHKVFRNERVNIDGRSFSNCTFENVTLVYEGSAPFSITNNVFRGSLGIDSPAPISSGMMLVNEIGRSTCLRSQTRQ